jgi:hypothetical protein
MSKLLLSLLLLFSFQIKADTYFSESVTFEVRMWSHGSITDEEFRAQLIEKATKRCDGELVQKSDFFESNFMIGRPLRSAAILSAHFVCVTGQNS